MAPEQLSQRLYSKASYVIFFLNLFHSSASLFSFLIYCFLSSDIWSYGVTAYEIMARSTPYDEMEATQVAMSVANGTLKPTYPETYWPELIAILVRCFEYAPEARPSAQQLVKQLQAFIRNVPK
jgi:serine/threonine protein kinase